MQGMNVVIFGKDSDMGKAIAKKTGGILVDTDVTSEQEVRDTFMKLRPDVIVNCAGVIYPNAIENIITSNLQKEIDVNLLGSFLIAKYACQYNTGIQIYISSTSALQGRAYWAGYCATKAGINSLVQSLNKEGRKAYAICPGRTLSKMRKSLFPKENECTLLKPERIANLVDEIIEYGFDKKIIVIKKDDFYLKD